MQFYLVTSPEPSPRFTASFHGAEVDGKGFSFWPASAGLWVVAIDGKVEVITEGWTFSEVDEAEARELGWKP